MKRTGDSIVTNERLREYFPYGKHNAFSLGRENAMRRCEFQKLIDQTGFILSSPVSSKMDISWRSGPKRLFTGRKPGTARTSRCTTFSPTRPFRPNPSGTGRPSAPSSCISWTTDGPSNTVRIRSPSRTILASSPSQQWTPVPNQSRCAWSSCPTSTKNGWM